jgi:hypothetical protein
MNRLSMKAVVGTVAVAAVMSGAVSGCRKASASVAQGVRGTDNGGSWVEAEFRQAAQQIATVLSAPANIALTSSAERQAIDGLAADGLAVLDLDLSAYPTGRFTDPVWSGTLT